ncbi:ABC transporter ATP-binding protein [Paenibacillus sp. MMS20-IR301]|uniref:ABC transporter ATP-binding protein n=1 Tax=Paenibacillus sp. MMS20-IR301 TaxID=2895946 RepID=UPI0028E45C4E|nr:ABC transporter ATP-binding protein [Paenibacillus sp. MMS20-IR301]WNS44935.1 ABC transporter ATP-binding protein [Paenibacillus sp. MMS20-IR301]
MILQSTDQRMLPAEDNNVPPLITLTRGSKLYGGRPVLNEVSLRITSGTATALVGRNGSGKSTLLAVLAGLLKPSSGKLEYGNRRLTIGYAPEAFPGQKLTAEEYLHFMGRMAGLAPAAAEERISALLDSFKLEAARSRQMAGFSKGMLQKINLIQSLLARPQLLLLDEPMSGLDLPAQETLVEQLLGLKGEGSALIFSVHEPETVEALADTVHVLQEGQIIRTIHGNEKLRTIPAVHITFKGLSQAEHKEVLRMPGIGSVQPMPDYAEEECTLLIAEQAVSDACLKQILAAGGSIISVERSGGTIDLAKWMDPKATAGRGAE